MEEGFYSIMYKGREQTDFHTEMIWRPNPLLDNKILVLLKLKAFADDKLMFSFLFQTLNLSF